MCQKEAVCVQGVVSTAGVPWLQGLEQHLAELGNNVAADTAGPTPSGSRKALRQDVRTKASPAMEWPMLLHI